MRKIGLDLGARHTAFCEVAEGRVVERASVRRFSELAGRLGPDTPPAVVAFESCREGWHVHDMLVKWGKTPVMLDTTRVRAIGVGHHGRKNDALDAEAIARALETGVREAHVLSPARRWLRVKLSVRSELVDARARQVTVVRGIARSVGVLLPTSSTSGFLAALGRATLPDETRALIAPLVAMLEAVEPEIERLDAELAEIAKGDDVIRLCATAPGVALVVAATFVSVIDDAKRFENAQAVGAYLGLAPGEHTTGGKRRLGSITKQGNTYARSMLVQAAWQILRAADASDPLREWGTEIAKKRGKKIAAIALARKLAGVLWAMWRDGTVYDPSTRAKESAAGLKAAAQSTQLRADAMERVAKKIQRRARKAPTPVPAPPQRNKTSRRSAV